MRTGSVKHARAEVLGFANQLSVSSMRTGSVKLWAQLKPFRKMRAFSVLDADRFGETASLRLSIDYGILSVSSMRTGSVKRQKLPDLPVA